jgi:hypothetical protein
MAWALYNSDGELVGGLDGAWTFYDASGVAAVPPVAPVDADYLVGTANAILTNEIVVGTTPGGELGGTWASPTIDTTHSGSAHHALVTLGVGSDAILALSGQELTLGDVATQAELDTHAGAADPHTVYQKESEKDAISGYAGLNTASRITKGAITTDDLIVDLATKGLVLKDTQGSPHYWRVTIDNTGALVTSDLGISAP